MYIKTKQGNIAHVLADKNIDDKTLDAIYKMVDIAYNKGLGGLKKPNINKMEQEIKGTAQSLTFGEQLAGVSFNPSKDAVVDEVKRRFAEIADLVNEQGDKNSTYLFNLIKGNALREILNAQMNVVKLLTLKY